MTDHAQTLLTAYATVLRRYRLAAGLSQESLAHDVGLSARYISLLETCRHQPTLGTMGDIAHRLGVPLAQLIAEAEAVAKAEERATDDTGQA